MHDEMKPEAGVAGFGGRSLSGLGRAHGVGPGRTGRPAGAERAAALALPRWASRLSSLQWPIRFLGLRRPPSSVPRGAHCPGSAGLWLRGCWAFSLVMMVVLGPGSAVGQTEGFEEVDAALLWESGSCEEVAELYLKEYPKGSDAAEARECLAWAEVRSCEDAGAVERFLRDYPKGVHEEAARECLAWAEVRSCEDIEKVREFRRRFPEGRYVAEASACVEGLHRHFEADRRLTICRAHEEAGRLTAGMAGDALTCYRDVLEFVQTDDQVRKALKGIARIEEHYVGKARTALEREQAGAVENAIGRLKEINPGHLAVEELETRLADLKQVLDRRRDLDRVRKTLIEKVEEMLAKGEHEQARAEVAAGRKAGLGGKALAELEERVDRDALVAEVRALVGARNVAGARARLAEAREGLLSDEVRSELKAVIEDVEAAETRTAERDALVASAVAQLEKKEYVSARKALEGARALGLSEADYEELSERIGRSERQARVSDLFEECVGHRKARRFEQGLDCAGKVLDEDPGHTEARRYQSEFERLLAWEQAVKQNTKSGYLEFERKYPGTSLAKRARQLREKLPGD